MARIIERGKLIAGVGRGAYLFSSPNAITGELEGFDIDIVHDIAFALFGDRNQVELRQVDSTDQLRVVESELVDLVVSTMTVTCRQLQAVEFSTVYLEVGQQVLVNRNMNVDGLEDLGGKRVCAARGSTSLNTIATAPSRPIPVGVANVTDCLMLLQLGEVAAISTHDTLLAGFAAQDPRTVVVGPRFAEEPYGVAVKRTNADLVRFVNAVLERRVADGTWQESYQRWLGSALGPPPAPPAARYRD